MPTTGGQGGHVDIVNQCVLVYVGSAAIGWSVYWHFIAAPWRGGWAEAHDICTLTVDVADAERGGGPESGITRDGRIEVIQIETAARIQVAVEIPLARNKDGGIGRAEDCRSTRNRPSDI